MGRVSFSCAVQLKCDGTRWRTGREVKRNWRMEWVASTLHTTSGHGLSSITTADAHTSAASSLLDWPLRQFKWTRPFRRRKKSGFCGCAITFQTQSTSFSGLSRVWELGDYETGLRSLLAASSRLILINVILLSLKEMSLRPLGIFYFSLPRKFRLIKTNY
jgi:hypothetical protein